MSAILNRLQNGLRKRAAYRRTLRALRQMPLETAIDLAMFHEDARKLAQAAVYGIPGGTMTDQGRPSRTGAASVASLDAGGYRSGPPGSQDP